MSVIRRLLPGNAKREIAHAAQIPKSKFAGTAMAATSNVRRMAAWAIGSPKTSR